MALSTTSKKETDKVTFALWISGGTVLFFMLLLLTDTWDRLVVTRQSRNRFVQNK